MKHWTRMLGCCWMVALCLFAGAASGQGPYEPTWESLARHEEAPDWFRDAKFGIYFHWGVYSVPAFGTEWYPRNMVKPGGITFPHHVETYGDPSEFPYTDFVPMFTAEHFDAADWAELFEEAGARFAGPVAEHHDGFAMWDSELTPWNAADKGPKRDITGELEKAIRARGMKFIATFHHARNHLWKPEGAERWASYYEFVEINYPQLLEDPEAAILYGHMSRPDFLAMWSGKLREVIDQYRPDLIWFDSGLDQIPEEVQREFLAYYFNQAATWDGAEVVVTRKQEDLPLEVSVEDFEKGRADKLTQNVWLTDDTLSKGSWGYTHDLEFKDANEVIDTFVDIISKNGVLLLNISPTADGRITDDQREPLREIGRWMRQNAEAIYGSRPWVIYGEGPQRMQGSGHFVKMEGSYGAEDIRFTTQGETLYAFVLGWPGDRLTIRALCDSTSTQLGLLAYPGEIGEIELLGSDAEMTWERSGEGLTIHLPETPPNPHVAVFKIISAGAR